LNFTPTYIISMGVGTNTHAACLFHSLHAAKEALSARLIHAIYNPNRRILWDIGALLVIGIRNGGVLNSTRGAYAIELPGCSLGASFPRLRQSRLVSRGKKRLNKIYRRLRELRQAILRANLVLCLKPPPLVVFSSLSPSPFPQRTIRSRRGRLRFGRRVCNRQGGHLCGAEGKGRPALGGLSASRLEERMPWGTDLAPSVPSKRQRPPCRSNCRAFRCVAMSPGHGGTQPPRSRGCGRAASERTRGRGARKAGQERMRRRVGEHRAARELQKQVARLRAEEGVLLGPGAGAAIRLWVVGERHGVALRCGCLSSELAGLASDFRRRNHPTYQKPSFQSPKGAPRIQFQSTTISSVMITAALRVISLSRAI
jgi:hypothetical protein